MCKCKLCGNEAMKGRQVCKGCQSLKRVAKSKEHTPKAIMNIASNHLEKNPGLLDISWKSFFKKNTKKVV